MTVITSTNVHKNNPNFLCPVQMNLAGYKSVIMALCKYSVELSELLISAAKFF